MIELAITLTSEDGSLKKAVECGFSGDEWHTIEQFHAEVEKLRSTKFVQYRRGGPISVTIEVGISATSKSKQLDTDEVSSLLFNKINSVRGTRVPGRWAVFVSG